jgi:putative ABC transport system permease protein
MRLPYALKIVLRERNRFLPALLAVTFSAVLVSAQAGMLVGFLATASRPIDRAGADVWVGSRGLPALGFGHPIEERWYGRLASEPEVVEVEPYLYGMTNLHLAGGAVEQVYVVGASLRPGGAGLTRDITPEQRVLLNQVGAVALYEPDRKLLNLPGVGTVGEINGQRVVVVAILQGPIKGAGLMAGLVCSERTARRLLPEVRPGHCSYLIARCRSPEQAKAVAQRLRARYPDMGTFTNRELARRTQTYWVVRTRAGLVLAFSATLGLLVGAVITTQTFYSATAAAWRELAVLRALGIPRRHVTGMLIAQALFVAGLGVVLAVPITLGLMRLGEPFNINAPLPAWLVSAVGGLTVLMALLSGLIALRGLRKVEPAELLR